VKVICLETWVMTALKMVLVPWFVERLEDWLSVAARIPSVPALPLEGWVLERVAFPPTAPGHRSAGWVGAV
jgi:hypothetical protein